MSIRHLGALLGSGLAAILLVIGLGGTASAGSAAYGTPAADGGCSRPVPAAVTLSSTHLYSGDTVTGRVVLSCAPGFRSVRVMLDAAPDGALTLPAEVTVDRGQTAGEFIALARPVAERTQVTVRATVNGRSATTAVTVDPGLKQFTASPWAVGGQRVGVTFNMTGTVPPEGIDIAMTSSHPAVTPPPFIHIPGGGLGFHTGVPSSEVTTETPVTLTARLGQTTLSYTLTLAPVPFDPGTPELTGPFVLVGGTTGEYTVTMTNPAPEGGLRVPLRDEREVQQVHLPSDVTIPAGETRATFPVTVDDDVPDHLFGAGPSIVADVAGLNATIQPDLYPRLLAMDGVPSTIRGGDSFTVTVTFKSAFTDAPLSVNARGDHQALNVPADEWGNIAGEVGSATITFTVTTDPVATATPVNLTITYPQAERTFPITITS